MRRIILPLAALALAGCMALITSRSPLAGLAALEGARSITLRVLSQPEARLMVSAITEP